MKKFDVDNIVFLSLEHKGKFDELVSRIKRRNAETISMMYLLALIGHENTLFDFDEVCIKPDGINASWQTDNTVRATRLAFSMWNGFLAEEDQYENNIYNIFGYSEWDRYYIEAIKLRYL